MKIYLPVGYNTNASYVSKDAPAEVQQDSTFYESKNFKYRFNEELDYKPSATVEQALPPRKKFHAAGVESNWASKPIPGQPKNWGESSASQISDSVSNKVFDV